MLRKIDCVMIRVDDPQAAARYYADTYGMRQLWQDDHAIGMGFPETDAEIVLHNDPNVPAEPTVHYLVDDVVAAVNTLAEKGCAVLEPPFDITIGKCAVFQDPFGTVLCILDMTKGSRT